MKKVIFFTFVTICLTIWTHSVFTQEYRGPEVHQEDIPNKLKRIERSSILDIYQRKYNIPCEGCPKKGEHAHGPLSASVAEEFHRRGMVSPHSRNDSYHGNPNTGTEKREIKIEDQSIFGTKFFEDENKSDDSDEDDQAMKKVYEKDCGRNIFILDD